MSESIASARLAELGIALPAVAAPAAAYVPSTRTGNLAFTAGQLPFVHGVLQATGKVGAEISAEQATDLARIAALNAIAAAASVAGGIDKLSKIVKVVVFVASAPDFTGQPAVANGASLLLQDVFGAAGVHARSAVGVAVLPLGSPVEIELIAEIAEG